MPFYATPGLDALDAVIISLDDSALMDGDLASRESSSSRASSIEVSVLINLSASFANLTPLLLEVGVLVTLFFSFSYHST